MKHCAVILFIAFVAATPIDNKPTPGPNANPIYKQQPAVDPIPLNSAPLSPATIDLHPLSKRDTPNSQNPQTVNLQKNKPSVPSPVAQKVDNTKLTDNNRKTRDTVQKTPTVGTPANAQNPQAVNLQKNKPSVPSPVAQKVDNTKLTYNNRKTRDTVQKTPTVGTPANAQPSKSVDTVKPQQTDNLSQKTRKTRELPKTEVAKKTSNENPQKLSPVTTNTPQIARVPLASTNSRSKRDTQKAVDQSKPSVAGSIKNDNTQALEKGKPNVAPSTAANSKPKRDTPAENTQALPSNNQGTTGLRRPLPVDQILKNRATSTEATTTGQ